MAKTPLRFLEVDPWVIEEKGLHAGRTRVAESVFSLGNEYMGVRGYFEEGYGGDTLLGSYFNGVFEETDVEHPVAYKGLITVGTFLINAVDWLHTRVLVGGERLDLAGSKFSDFTRRLDLRTGVLTREFVWHAPGGRKLRVRFERFTSMADANVGAQRVTFEALNFRGRARVRMGLNFATFHEQRGVGSVWAGVRAERRGDVYALLGRLPRSGQRVFASMRLAGAPAKRKLLRDERFIGCEFSLPLRPGRPTSVERIAVNHAERSPRKADRTVWDRGVSLARRHAKTTFDTALARHAAYWRKVWDELDVVIEGDPATQQGVRFCIFQMHQTYHGVDPRLNVSAKGLTGEEYWGVAWWDTEAYCLPFYLFNNPKAARNLLSFRHRTLRGAMERARQLDCRGARYPMCTIDGRESCTVWQHGDLQIHVSAAVAYGIRHYVHVTGDKEFLYGPGVEMLIQIARYYASRGAWSPRTGEFGFWGVMGPDEFHMMVHNNAYTNVMARKSFEWALAALKEMRRAAPARLAKVVRRTRLADAEPKAWKRMAAKMRVPRDPRTGVYEQHDGYFDMPHMACEEIPPEQLPLYAHWAYVRLFRHDMIKQPDALLLPFLFSHEHSDEVKKANYEYYEPRCSHESSLSPAVFAILASELGRHDDAYRYAMHASRLDLDDYNRNTREGLHTTSMAAAWMNVVHGYGGMRSDGAVLSFRPSIPKRWKRFSFRVLYRDSVLETSVDRTSVSLRAVRGPGAAVEVFGKRCFVDADGVRLRLPANRRG